MSREVLKQALEVMEFAKDGNAGWTFLLPEAITAIKAALAQLEEEPVGFVVMERQPPEREWVGLTDEEVLATINSLNPRNSFIVANAIEARLREKNK